VSRDTDIANDVREELAWDRRVDSAAIAVSADDGKVTLRSTVRSLRKKREAEKDARRVGGVASVDNQLDVEREKRDDADLRGDVLRALALDNEVPKTVDATVGDGLVTLIGTADWQYQRDEAEHVVSNIVGTLDVIDTIELTHPAEAQAGDVQEAIKRAFERNAAVDAEGLEVSLDTRGHHHRQRELMGRA
jgi:osmotically-inducible protein OsmY